VLATGGNLVFHAAPDGRLLAYTADKGERVWEATLGGGISTPVSYMIDGKQYVSVLAGRGNGRLYTLVLDGKEPLPPVSAPPAERRGSSQRSQ
jgi:quinohemoprotein ethanol dehydrogenase